MIRPAMTARTILLLSLLGALSLPRAGAQQRTVERSVTMDEGGEVMLDMKHGDEIIVRGWDRNEVSFHADIEINGGRLNEALLLDFEEGEGSFRVASDFDKQLMKKGRREDCPDRSHTTYNRSGNGRDAVLCTRITYTVHVPRQATLRIETISGDILLEGPRGDIHARSVSGFVDLSWPDGLPAEISLKTVSGEAYSNLETVTYLNRREHPAPVGYTLRGRISGGGPSLLLESVSGNIYLRKSS